MKFKLDENIGRRGLELLRASGHDVMTVRDQHLGGVADQSLFDICAAEGRALVTLDRDFGQVPRFPPESSAGIVILETGPRTTLQEILQRIRDFLAILESQPLIGTLWIVERGRVEFISAMMNSDRLGWMAEGRTCEEGWGAVQFLLLLTRITGQEVPGRMRCNIRGWRPQSMAR